MSENLPGNSRSQSQRNRPRLEPEKPERIVEGKVITRKRPWQKKMVEVFFPERIDDVGEYILWEVLIPAIRDSMWEVASSGVDRFFGAGSDRQTRSRRPSTRGNRGGYSSHTNYNRMSEEPRTNLPHRGRMSREARIKHDFDEIILESRAEAEEVIDNMFDWVEKYNAITVAHLYEMIGETGDYTDDKWGWTDIRGAGITRVRGGGYLLDLPKPEPLD